MFHNIDYNNFPFIISSGDDFTYELNAIKNEIFPSVKSYYFPKKHFSVNCFDLIYPNPKPMDILSNPLKDFVSINLDSIKQNGSISICLLGENFERLPKLYEDIGYDYPEFLENSLQIAADSGYPWIYNMNNNDRSSMLEVLSFYNGLLSEIKYPLFYFRVSGGPISDDDDGNENEIESKQPSSENDRMENLKQILIRQGLPIKFYGSASEFNKAFRKDLMDIFERFPDKISDQDDMFIDQQIFAKDRLQMFTFNENIKKIFSEFNSLYTSLTKWTLNETNSNPEARIDELLNDFYRKDFSDKLSVTIRRLNERTLSHISTSYQDNKILVLTGSRGSGKSSILINWLQSKTKKIENHKIMKVALHKELRPLIDQDDYSIFVEIDLNPEPVKQVYKSSKDRYWGRVMRVPSFLAEILKEDTDVICIPYYCEASYASSDLQKMLNSLIKRIRLDCGYNLEQDDYETYSLETEMLSLSQKFLGAMLLAKNIGHRLLIIIDGIDHLGDKCAFSTKQIKSTDWIPEVIPENVRIIITSTASDSSLAQIKFKRTDIAIIEVLPGSIDEQNELIKSGIDGLKTWISKHGQVYPSNFPQPIYSWPLIANPLIQKILARVYHTLGTTVKWKSFIEKASECQTLVELVRRVLKFHIYHINWELTVKSDKLKKNYIVNKEEEMEERSIQGWVPDCLSLLVLSRNGLPLDIILSCLDKLGYVKDFEVVESDVWSLFHLTREIILKFHNEKFKFTHSICKEIVEHAFLAIASCSSVEARTRECQEYMYIDKRCKFHLLLAYHFWNQRNANLENISECVYHLDRGSDYESMETVLFLPRTLLGLFNLDASQLTNWHGQLTNTHYFQYYKNILSSKGCDFVNHILNLLNTFYYLEFDAAEAELEDGPDGNDQKLVKLQYQKSIPYQSDFTKRFKIHVDRDEERESWLTLEQAQRNHFMLFLGRICELMDQMALARKIFNYLEDTLDDKVLLCSILWFDISLDSSLQTIFRNEDYILLVLNKLDDLTADLLKDDWFDGSTENDTIKYIRSMCLILKCSIGAKTINEIYSPSEYHELRILSESFNSVILNCLVKEMNFNSMGETKDVKITQQKILMLSNIIILLETWTGPAHSHMARLFVKLSRLFEHGNSQLRFKAEACCRRALWIWKYMTKNKTNDYNSEENECREILFQFLIKDPCKSSIIEAKNQIYLTFDSRMKYLGCYHPLTVNLVPSIKLMNNLSDRSRYLLKPDSKILLSNSSKRSIPGSSSFTRNQSNLRVNRSVIDTIGKSRSAESNKVNDHRISESYGSSLQFINRYSKSADGFSEDIDWNEIAHSSSTSLMSRFSVSRIQSAALNNHSSISVNLPSTPVRSQSVIVGNDVPSHIYFGPNSSLRSLCSPSAENHNRASGSRNGKQVRFINLTKSGKGKFIQTEMAKMIQQKVQEMKLFGDTININQRRSVSTNFSRPYSNTTDLIF